MPTPPPATPSAHDPAARRAQEAALLQTLLARIPTITDRAQLFESADMALRLLLRRDTDHALLTELLGQLRQIRIEPDQRRAAFLCQQVIQTARRERQPRPAGHSSHGAGHPSHAAGPPKNVRRAAPLHRMPAWGWALLAVIALGGATMLVGKDERDTTRQAAATLLEQMQQAAHGSVASPHVFGGALKLLAREGEVMVVAEGVPPAACVSVGWQLVRKGTVSVNGNTPMRASAARLTELCHQDDGDAATLSWVPRPGD